MKDIRDWRVPDLEWLPAAMLQVESPPETGLIILPFPETGAVIQIHYLYPMFREVDDRKVLQTMVDVLAPTGEWVGFDAIEYFEVMPVHTRSAERASPGSPGLLDAIEHVIKPFRKKRRGSYEERIIDPLDDHRKASKMVFLDAWPTLYTAIDNARKAGEKLWSDDTQKRFAEALFIDREVLGLNAAWRECQSALKSPPKYCDPLKWFVICNWLRMNLHRYRPEEILQGASKFGAFDMTPKTLDRSLRRWGLQTSLLPGPRHVTESLPEFPKPPQGPSDYERLIKNSPETQVYLGMISAKNSDFDNARLFFSAAIDAGSSDAMYQMALLLQNPTFQEQEQKEGISWLEKASKRGHSEASFCLAKIELSQPATFGDYKKGKMLLLKAAEAHIPDAQFELGRRLLFGESPFRKNATSARTWLQRAAFLDHREAQVILGMEKGTGLSTVDSLAWLTVGAVGCQEAWDYLSRAQEGATDLDRLEVRLKAAEFRELISIARTKIL